MVAAIDEGGRRMANPRVLELRVHGVNNTTPADMLGLSEDSIQQTAGDNLGSFWTKKPTCQPPPRTGDDGAIQVEAYSWGGMARTSFGGPGGGNKVLRVAARAGWILLLPFGLVNVGYWTRAFDDGPNGPERPRDWRHARGAPSMRIFGLLLTLLMVMTASIVVLDLVSVQCFPRSPTRCGALPKALDFLSRMGQTQRLALLGLVPVLMVAALELLSAGTRLRYEQPNVKGEEAANAEPDWPVMSTRGFWSHRQITKKSGRLHLAASASLVSAMTACHVYFGSIAQCSDETAAFLYLSGQCITAVESTGASSEVWVMVASVLGLVLVAISLIVQTAGAADVARIENKRLVKAVNIAALGLSAVVFVWQTWILMHIRQEPTGSRLVGASSALSLMLVVMLVLAVSALMWRDLRTGALRFLPICLSVVLMASVLALASPFGGPWKTAGAAAILILSLAGIVMVKTRLRAERRHESWRGSAPGVFMMVALVLAMVLSNAVVVAAGDWLNGALPPSDLAHHIVERHSVAPSAVGETDENSLGVPLLYTWYGLFSIAGIALLLFVIALAFERSWTWTEPVSAQPGVKGQDRGGERTYTATGHSPVANTRRLAAFAHRAEPVLAALAAVGGLTMTAVLCASMNDASAPGWWRPGVDWGMWLLAGTGLAVIGMAVGAPGGSARPLGLAWDLMAFLPRAAHPLAPPCYAERAVPELVARGRRWLTPSEHGDDAVDHSTRQVVLSAHSLGSVLAVAVLLAPEWDDAIGTGRSAKKPGREQLALLTYGSQLRAYFSRLLPELLGPLVLGIPPCRSSSLLRDDPWHNEMSGPAPKAEVGDGSVANILGGRKGRVGAPRWRNLWRRTDYLGFPVCAYRTRREHVNITDVPADEVVEVHFLPEVQTHGGYPFTQQYESALRELAGFHRDSHRDGAQPPAVRESRPDQLATAAVAAGTGAALFLFVTRFFRHRSNDTGAAHLP
jgi:hypothetical protein